MTNKEILNVLYKILKDLRHPYKSNWGNNDSIQIAFGLGYFGICQSFCDHLDLKHNDGSWKVDIIHEIIPEFTRDYAAKITPKTIKTVEESRSFWWEIGDFQSRITFVIHLIKLYKAK